MCQKKEKNLEKLEISLIFDAFKGQCVEIVFILLDDNNILYVIVPANCTDKLQPLDLSVNKPAKYFMRSKFQDWYSEIIKKLNLILI